MSTENDEFEAIINKAAQNKEEEVFSFSTHPDDEQAAAELIKVINERGGVREAWKPILFGVVTEVEDYWLTEKERTALNTEIKHEQKVTWISTTGYKFIRGWNDQKLLNINVDVIDFPEGFKKLDCIRVEADGAMVTKIKRVSLQDIKISLGLESPETPEE